MMLDMVLGDGYPYPYPRTLPEDEQEELNQTVSPEGLRLRGVSSFEWRFTFTVQFVSREAFDAAKAATGWSVYDDRGLILEASTSRTDGREFPAIIVGGTAYCRLFMEGAA